MEESSDPAVVDSSSSTKMATAPREIVPKRKGSDTQVTSFQAAMAMPDLLDPPTSASDPSSDNPSSGDANTSDDTSPLSFMGTPYSTSQQFDYPFPISNAPRDPAVPPTPLPSALPIASSLASAPSIVTAAASSDEASESAATNPLPSMVSTIAASLDLPNNISELRSLLNQSSSSLNSTHSTHSGHTKPVMIPVASSGASIRSMSSASPAGSLQGHSQVAMAGINSQVITSQGPRQKGRHSLTISPLPPPPLSIHTNMPKLVHSPQHTRRPKAVTVNSTGSTGSETSPPEARPTRSRPPSGSHSSLSIASMQLLSGPGEPPIPPSLLTKLNRPRNTSNSTSSSYFSANPAAHQAPNSRDFFSSPGGNEILNASAPSSPMALGTDSSIEFFKTTSPPPSKSSFGTFRPLLGRSNSSTGHGYGHNHNHSNHSSSSSFSGRPFFARSTTANPQLQSRAYAQHMRHQQQQQLKRQEDQRKKVEKEKEKQEKKKEKKERKGRRSSLSLTRSQSSSSSSSAKTKSSTSIMSKSPSSASIAEGFKLSPTQRSIVENAVSESEGSASPEGTKVRRRSSVRRVLEKTGSLVGFNLNINAAKRAAANP